MPPGPKKVRVDDHLSRACSDTGIEPLLNGGLGQFHVGVTNNLKIGHLLNHSCDFGEQIVRIITSAAMIDQEEGLLLHGCRLHGGNNQVIPAKAGIQAS